MSIDTSCVSHHPVRLCSVPPIQRKRGALQLFNPYHRPLVFLTVFQEAGMSFSPHHPLLLQKSHIIWAACSLVPWKTYLFIHHTDTMGPFFFLSSHVSRKADGKRERWRRNQSIQPLVVTVKDFIHIIVTAATLSYNTMAKSIFLYCHCSISLVTSTQKSLGKFLRYKAENI